MSSVYLKVTFSDEFLDEEECDFSQNRIAPFAIGENFTAPIQSAQKLTKHDDVKTVYKLTFNLKNIKQEFQPGDTIGIYPTNNENLILKILVRLGIEAVADKPCQLQILPATGKKDPTIPKHLPQKKSTLKNIFLNHVNVQTPPKKLFLKTLARFTQDSQEQARLVHICSAKAVKEYNELITSSGKTLLELLETFPSCHPPVEAIIEHLPPLLPRPYSISSSPLSDKLEITFFIFEHNNGYKGVCTGWLEELISRKSTEFVPFYFRQPTKFRLPFDTSIPLILVATGTGIAPFRGFLQHRQLQRASGNIWLFYGCRYRDRDFLYGEEMDNYLKSRVLTRLDVSFSRDGKEKSYVQHNIEKHGAEFIEWLLKKKANIFVCGNEKTMVRNVKISIINNLVKHGSMNDSAADNYMQEMHATGKFIVDMWS